MKAVGGTPPANVSRGAWFREAKFAMFVHFGLYSRLAGQWQGRTYHGISEWIQYLARIPAADYAATAREFNPAAFDARELVGLAKAAGMKYIVITAKHHEGFALFQSAASQFNIVEATPFGRDLLRELAGACREQGLRLGFYYSQTADWHEPDALGNTWDEPGRVGDFNRYLRRKALPQIEELLRNYGPIALVWFDTPGPISKEDSAALIAMVRRLQPDCLINSRIGNGLGDYETLGDADIPVQPPRGQWEAIDTHNDSWGYAAADHNWKSPRELLERLLRVVSRGGNYMLNVGPDGSGRVPEISARILRAAGAWVHGHAEAIYGTLPSPIGFPGWGECTARPGRLYLHVFRWPGDGRLVVPGLGSPVRAARWLGAAAPSEPRVEQRQGHVVIHVPAGPPEPLIPVIVLDVADPVRAHGGSAVLNGCPNALPAHAATVVGCRKDKLSWMDKFGAWQHAECLSAWTGAGSSAVWEFALPEAGAFQIALRYSNPLAADYSEWSLATANARWTFPLVSTGVGSQRTGQPFGDPHVFRELRIGLLEFDAPGDYALTLRPLDQAGAGAHIESLRLLPVDIPPLKAGAAHGGNAQPATPGVQ